MLPEIPLPIRDFDGRPLVGQDIELDILFPDEKRVVLNRPSEDYRSVVVFFLEDWPPGNIELTGSKVWLRGYIGDSEDTILLADRVSALVQFDEVMWVFGAFDSVPNMVVDGIHFSFTVPDLPRSSFLSRDAGQASLGHSGFVEDALLIVPEPPAYLGLTSLVLVVAIFCWRHRPNATHQHV